MPIVAANAQTIAEAARLLRAGQLVAFPTETVYGLGADASQGLAVAAIFEAKGRPRFNPLIVHVPDLAGAKALGAFNDTARRLAAEFWPGPLTLVLPKRPGAPIAELATAGLDTIALRVPSHPIAQALLRAAGCPVAAPSANRSGHVSATEAAHVAADLGEQVALILDAGPAEYGLESTVLDATAPEPVILRPGAVTAEAIARVLGIAPRTTSEAGARPSSPGQLASHYAPRAAVRLNATDVAPGEALLAFGANVPAHAGPTFNLSPSGDLREAAANLFAALRGLDAAGCESLGTRARGQGATEGQQKAGVSCIAAMPIPDVGLGAAINDRLRRAAAPR